MSQRSYVVVPSEDNTNIIFHIPSEPGYEIPTEQKDLQLDIDASLETIKGIYPVGSKAFSLYFDHLLKIARAGLVGDNAQPSLAKRALEQLKMEITNKEAGRVKNQYLKQLGSKAILFGTPALIVGTLLYYNECKDIFSWDCVDCPSLAGLCILWFGTMIGVWLSFMITRTSIGFEDLVIIEKDRLEPKFRLIFTGVVAIIFDLLFIKKAIVISLGDLSSNDIREPITAFLFGVILGLNEKIIGGVLTKKTVGLFEK